MLTLIEDAQKYLRLSYSRGLPRKKSELAAFLRENAWTPVSDGNKHAMIATAYALVLLHDEDEKLLDLLAAQDARKRKRPDPARLFVEAIESDPHTEPTAREQARRRSAWAACVRELHRRKIAPSKVEGLAGKPGEGIDAWSKAAAKRGKPRLTPRALQAKKMVSVKIKGVEINERWDMRLTAIELTKLVKHLRAIDAACKKSRS